MIGIWWYYLLHQLALKGQLSNVKLEKFYYMLKWEGITFFSLFLIVSSYLVYFYLKDLSKNKTMQNFFASVTHELKTPLASIKLQAEVLEGLFQSPKSRVSESANDKQMMYLTRLLEDTQKLETELDNILHLSRVQRGGTLNLKSVDLRHFMRSFLQEYNFDQNMIEVHYDCSKNNNDHVLIDEYALQVILKNLIDNAIKHSDQDKVIINITVSSPSNDSTRIVIHDNGKKFNGDIKKLGSIFYKSNSQKGSGIGLYLVKNLTLSMNGSIDFLTSDSFKVILNFDSPVVKTKKVSHQKLMSKKYE